MEHDEFALIRLLNSGRQSASWLRQQGVVTGIGDDAAVAAVTPGFELVMSCDTMVEDIHFSSVTMRDEDVGFKAMASNLSDMAAMGAIPRYALVALSLPKQTDAAKVRRMYDGLYECADAFGVAVVGGDTTSTAKGGIVMTITILGEVEAGCALLRSSAKTGDAVFVAGGALGGAAAGLHYLQRRGIPAAAWGAMPPPLEGLVRAHCRPQPQVAAGRLLQRTGLCRALNDISDGLASEAGEIAEASGVGIAIAEGLLPRLAELDAYAAEAEEDPLGWVLYGGEDYRLLGTIAEENAQTLQQQFQQEQLEFQIIGHVTDAFNGVRLNKRDGSFEVLEKKGYNHFQKR